MAVVTTRIIRLFLEFRRLTSVEEVTADELMIDLERVSFYHRLIGLARVNPELLEAQTWKQCDQQIE